MYMLFQQAYDRISLQYNIIKFSRIIQCNCGMMIHDGLNARNVDVKKMDVLIKNNKLTVDLIGPLMTVSPHFVS